MKHRNYLLILFFLLIVQFARTGNAAEPLGKRIVLDNGMILLLSEKHDIPMVTMNMAIKAGSMAEPADKPGLASITASLLTQGTAKRTANQISREIDFVGGSLSASGGDDFASASLRVLKKDLRTGLDLLSDVLLNPVFDQKEIDRKVKETLAEIQRQKEEPDILREMPLQKLSSAIIPTAKPTMMWQPICRSWSARRSSISMQHGTARTIRSSPWSGT